MVGTGQISGGPGRAGATGSVIDLGVLRDDPDDTAPRRPFGWRQLRPAALAAVAALLLSTGGSALPPPPALTEIATVPYGPGTENSPYPWSNMLLTEDRLFTSALEPGSWTNLVVSAYELERGQPVWTYALPAVEDSRPLLQHQAGLLLLSAARPDGTAGMRTVALDARTGRERWSVPHDVRALPDGDTALAVDRIFPADALIPEGTRPPRIDMTYGSPWGMSYSAPESGVLAAGIDLTTGEVRWKSELLASVVTGRQGLYTRPGTAVDGGSTNLAVVTGDGEVQLWDVRTGAVRHRFPAHQPDTYLDLGEKLLLVHHGAGEVTAYSTADYRPRWTRAVGQNGSVGFCGGSELICASSPAGLWEVADPETGERIWQGIHGHEVVEGAGHLIEVVSGNVSPEPVRTVDPRTGEPLVNLIGWREATLWSDGPVLLTDAQGMLGPSWLGLLRPNASAPVTLGRVPVGVSDCQVDTSVIACRTYPRDVRIWRYRATLLPGDQ